MFHLIQCQTMSIKSSTWSPTATVLTGSMPIRFSLPNSLNLPSPESLTSVGLSGLSVKVLEILWLWRVCGIPITTWMHIILAIVLSLTLPIRTTKTGPCGTSSIHLADMLSVQNVIATADWMPLTPVMLMLPGAVESGLK